eukprot:TRINITY_DN43854_c0_g1_i1.p3 TRINITY_DN43854_c0_g1~~TRINITY_DN43854_c0_g1_i1.p3  ORF type:complete len:125 (-),score=14.14 TRINITY_DN43854_c0_g1_i1:28-366(-)
MAAGSKEQTSSNGRAAFVQDRRFLQAYSALKSALAIVNGGAGGVLTILMIVICGAQSSGKTSSLRHSSVFRSASQTKAWPHDAQFATFCAVVRNLTKLTVRRLTVGRVYALQ